MKKHIFATIVLAALGAASYFTWKSLTPAPKRPSGAGASFQFWNMARTYPDGVFHTEKYTEALALMQGAAQNRNDRDNTWEAIGPKNIGGRTLCLAFHPQDTNILWVGSASGGIWKSLSAGRGVNAWQRVETGFPVLGVSALAIDPINPNTIYAGTGEVYNAENSAPNVAFRTTRGTYGIGILKSTDGGGTWIKSLDWGYGQLRGVQDIKINRLRPATVYAATTEGLYRSYDAGNSWQLALDRKMAVDIEMHPTDTSIMFVTYGSLDDEAVSGIFRTQNAGTNWQQLSSGLPAQYGGKTLVSISKSNPQIVYASVGNAFAQEGLYKSINGGNTWNKVNSSNVCSYQGWYSHDVAVKPDDPNVLIWVGIDSWKSTNGGLNATKKTQWSAWTFGQVPVGGPEGPTNYVHADIHRVYFTENDPNKVYFVTDGGIFVSYDAGEKHAGRNGGYQTQQFYATMGHSTTNPNLSIGGMQDNSTAFYTGSDAWTRVLGGDGQCAAIHPDNDQIMFGSSQYLNIARSDDSGNAWNWISSAEMDNEQPAFNGAFEIAPADPNVLYAGAQSLFRSFDLGNTWDNASSGFLTEEGDIVLTIASNPNDIEEIMYSTAPLGSLTARVRKIRLNGTIPENIELTGLPDRLCMDIAWDNASPGMVYAVFAGFNTEHVFRSDNNGITWTAIDNGLPDVPTNSILIDPLQPNNLYVGNDLGVWFSSDAGASWSLFSAGAPQALLAMHLGISADRKLRVASYGLGVWQADMAPFSSTNLLPTHVVSMSVFPNPSTGNSTLKVNFKSNTRTSVEVRDMSGRVVHTVAAQDYTAGQHQIPLRLSHLPIGNYAVGLNGRAVRMLAVVR